MGSPRGGQEERSRYLNRGAGTGGQSDFLRESESGSPGAMQGEVPGEEALLQKLRDSRRRFQRRMQQLLEKYNKPFEDDPLVQMSTLTYKTPSGWKEWGGSLVKEGDKGQIQGSPVQAAGGKEGPAQATARGPELLEPCTPDPGADGESSADDASVDQEEVVAETLTPGVPWSPLKDDLRRKYLARVDALLRESTCSEHGDYGDADDTRVTLVPCLGSPPRPAHGYRGSAPEEHPSGPFNPAASSRSCSTDAAVVPRNDSLWLQESRANSFSSSQSFEADICSVTLSDLYAGMLHSMSRLLSARPSCVISTKTFIVQNWSSRRRHKCRSRMNRTYNQGGRHARRIPPGTLLPCPQPVKEGGVLKDCQNVRDALSHEAGLKLEKAFFAANKPQICKLDPGWKELKRTPQKLSSLTSAGCSAVCCLDQENRLMSLKWLISPVKIVPRPRVLQGEGGARYKELENEFNRLHREYFLSPGKQPRLPGSSRVRMHTAGLASPGAPWGSDIPRPRTAFGKATPKNLKEAFDNLGRRAIEAERCLAKSHSFPLLPKTNPTRSPGRPQLTADLLQGSNPGVLKKSVSLSKAVSDPAVRPLGGARDRYDEIKEKFDKLHQKYCQKSPRQTKVPLYTGASPGKARDFSGKINPDSGFPGPQKLSSSPQWSIKCSWGSSTVIYPHACSAVAARRCPQPLVKRRRLSDPPVCGSWADSQHPSRTPGRAIVGPKEQGGSSQPDQERKRKEDDIFQDGREK